LKGWSNQRKPLPASAEMKMHHLEIYPRSLAVPPYGGVASQLSAPGGEDQVPAGNFVGMSF
jgi:hypothetical protein